MFQMQHTLRYCEKSFLLTAQQSRALSARLEGQASCGKRGSYPVLDLYYDTAGCDLARASLEDPRRKVFFRLRSHGAPKEQEIVYAELRRTLDDAVCKRRAAVPFAGLEQLLGGEVIPQGDAQVQREIHWLLRRYGLAPRALIGYRRTAYTSLEDPNLRITLDREMCWRKDALDLRAGVQGEPLLAGDPDGTAMLKVRVDRVIPLWLAGLLSELSLYPAPFTKYGVCCQRHLAEGLRAERKRILC